MTLGRYDATSHVSRREFLSFGAASFLGVVASWRRSAVQDSLPGTGPAGKLFDPQRAGRPLEPVLARDNLDAIQAIEKQLHCTCGCNLDIYTCRTTDFNCTVSPALHRQVLARYEAGQSAQQILDAFVAAHGETILMSPPQRGFNLVGYFLPGALVLGAAVLLIVVLRRWTRFAPDRPTVVPAGGPPATPAELDHLRRELEQIDA